jgi:hypothetical protein
MRGLAVNIRSDLTLATEECCKCGVLFAVSEDLRNQWRKTKATFYCPNGHPQSYTESEADQLRRQLEAAQRDAEWQKNRAASMEKQLVAQRGVVTKLKKRVGAGVCPCCQRTFKQLAAHMQTKHPEMLTANVKPVEA